MIDQTMLVTYLAVLLGFVFIPGPAVLLTLARASSSGTRVGIATGLGIAAGDLVHTVLAVVGISAVVLASAFLFSLVKYLGTVTVAVAAGGVGRFLRRNPLVLRWQGKVVGTIYCALGLRLALQEK